MPEVSKRDWKLFREKIGGWQENYMAKLDNDYIQLLSSDQPASKKFWALEKRIRNDKRKPGVIIELKKKETYYDLAYLIQDGVITMDDLEDFSDECKAAVSWLL